MKTGLVLEGGAMRGIYTAGVLDVFLEQGISPGMVMGVSAGAIHGISFLSRQGGRSIRYYMKYCRDKRFMSFYSLVTTGDVVGEQFCYHDIPDTLDPFDHDAFEASGIPFWAVCSNLETGQGEYIRCPTLRGEAMEYLRASASMPLAAQVVEVGGLRLLDGGMADSIPIQKMESLGYERNVVILTQPLGFVKEKNSALPLMRLALRKYPKLLDTMSRRHQRYNETTAYIREKERRGELFVLRPEAPLDIGKGEHNREKIQAVYDMGRRVMEKRLDALRAYLEQ